MIAPHELKNKAFNKTVRGYAVSEVDDYIDFLIDKYTEVYRKNAELENELHNTKLKYSELHHDEDSIRAVIVKAQKLGENIVSQARVEADKIIEASRNACKEKIEEAETVIAGQKAEALKVSEKSEEFRRRLYDEYLEHLKLLKEMQLSLNFFDDDKFSDEVEQATEERIEQAKDKISTIRSDENETIIV